MGAVHTSDGLTICVVGARLGQRLAYGKPWTLHGSSSLFSPLWDIFWLVTVACKTLVVLVYLGWPVRCLFEDVKPSAWCGASGLGHDCKILVLFSYCVNIYVNDGKAVKASLCGFCLRPRGIKELDSFHLLSLLYILIFVGFYRNSAV